MFDICPNNETHTEQGDSFGGDAADDTKRRIVRKELASCYQRYRVMAARRLRDEIQIKDGYHLEGGWEAWLLKNPPPKGF